MDTETKTRDDLLENRPSSPIVISTDDEGEMSTPPPTPPPPVPKRVKFAETADVRTYLIDDDHKELKKTRPVRKRRWDEFFPTMKEKLLAKVADKEEKDGTRVSALRKLELLCDTNERVEKLNRGDDEPLNEEERTDFNWRKLEILEDSKRRREEEERKKIEMEDPPTPPPPPPPKKTETLTEDTADIRVNADSFAGINCQFMIANEINKGGSCKEIQNRIDEKLKDIDFVYYLPGKLVKLKMCVHDRKMNGKVPVDYDGEEQRRYCESCKVNVKLTDWPQHISTMFHQIMFKYRVLRLSFCWTGFNGRRPHIPSECNTCLSRLDRNSDDKDMLLADYTRYKGEDDHDLIENMDKEVTEKQTIKNMEQKSDMQCPVCPEKKIYSKEFLEKHLTGRYHRDKLKKLKSEKKDTTPQATATSVQTKKANKKTDTDKQPTKKSSSTKGGFLENCIRTVMGNSGKPDYYECQICDLKMKFQRNVNSHLKTKRHQKNKKERMVTSDESVEVASGNSRDTNNLEEMGFVRDAGEKGRPGVHFLVTTEKPVKYKVAKRMSKFMFSCQLCCKYFRSVGLLRRHREGKEHILNYRNLKRHQSMRKRFLKKNTSD